VSKAGTVALDGSIPDLRLKADFLTAIAASGKFPEIQASGFTIDTKRQPPGWPAGLPSFTAFLLTRTSEADLLIDPDHVRLQALALDGPARDQIERRFKTLDFKKRKRIVEIDQSPGPVIPEDGFFLKSTLLDDGRNELVLRGRLPSRQMGSQIVNVLKIDLPTSRIQAQIEEARGIDPPEWAGRLPNLLSLLHTRTRSARATATQERLHIVGEMRESEAPEDLADVMALMLGSQVIIESHLLPFEQSVDGALASDRATPPHAASSPDKTPSGSPKK
jgi:hypothetical protein